MLDRLRLWLARNIVPRTHAVIRGRQVSPFHAENEGRLYAVGFAMKPVDVEDVVSIEMAGAILEDHDA